MRANYFQRISREINQLSEIETNLAESPLGMQLTEMIKLRVSQINGCAFCVSLHSQQLRILEETEERIALVNVWSEAPCYTDRERTAFHWAESLTRLADGQGVGDELYQETVDEFGEEGICQLSLAVAMINTWNRLAISFQTDLRHIETLLKTPTQTAN